MLCDYKDLLGKPGKGIHSLKIMNFAVIDILFTIVLGLILSKSFKINTAFAILLSFLIGILFHRLFCVKTTLDIWLKQNII